MTFRAVLAPLASGATYRRGVYLLLGGVLVLPYALLTGVFARMFTGPSDRWPTVFVLATVTAVIAAVPAFLRGTRALEIVAVRSLLRVDLPDPPQTAEPARVAREARLRAALWFAMHLVVGGLVGLALLIMLPMALVFVVQQFGLVGDALKDTTLGPFDGDDRLALTAVGVALLIALVYAVAGLGALAGVMAPVLLGPSPTERIIALEARARQLAERNRLARELHDSVGHALTVTTLQAAAAGQVLDTDPAFVRRALAAIEESGRTAMEDLDRVLGVLRDGEPATRAPSRTLADMAGLVDEVRATGREVDVDVAGPVGELPDAVSREGYRIVQEGLTNALRHAAGAPVTLRVAVGEGVLAIDLVNPATPATRPSPGAGQGLDGIRERVTLLGGQLAAGRDGELWRVAARIPVAAP